jgi:hypothetical protein
LTPLYHTVEREGGAELSWRGDCLEGKTAHDCAKTAHNCEEEKKQIVRYQTVKDSPRVVSPILKCYFESFEPLPPTLEDCVIKTPETLQEKLLFGILVDAGMVLSDKQAESYHKPHFWIQKERTHRREDHRKPNSD